MGEDKVDRKKIVIIIAICVIIALSIIFAVLKMRPLTAPSVIPSFATPQRSSVEIINAMPKLVVGDKVIPITGFFTVSDPFKNEESLENVKKYIDLAAENGYSVVIVGVNWGYMDKREELESPPENAADAINWTPLDAVFDYAASKGVYVVIHFAYMKVPLWWYHLPEDRGCIQTSNTGEICLMPSFNAPCHERYADQVITALANRYKGHPAHLGWSLGHGRTEEDNYPGGEVEHYGKAGWFDYSDFAKECFREYLHKEYESIEALMAAWSDSTVTFETAEPPQPLPMPLTFEEMIEAINGPGDARRQFYDWQMFRIEEKRRSKEHFEKLYKTLDPDHVLFATPTMILFSNAKNRAQNLKIDYYTHAASPYTDVVLVHPGITDKYMKNSEYISSLYAFLKYYVLHEKASLIKWENWGANGVKPVRKAAILARYTDTGLLLWEGGNPYPSNPLEIIPAYNEKQIKEAANTIKERNKMSTLKNSEFAIIEDSKLGAFDYLCGSKFAHFKGKELRSLASMLFEEGLDFDVLEMDEIEKNPEVLNNYRAVALVDVTRMNEAVLEALITFRNDGGGIFVVGRTALYDKYGNKNAAMLGKLLDVSITGEYKNVPYSWSFEEQLGGLKGSIRDEGSILYIPTFDYEKEGYEILAKVDGTDIAVIGYKNKTVFWFGKIDFEGLQREGMRQFLRSLYEFYGISDRCPVKYKDFAR